jgi:hypothetical protein
MCTGVALGLLGVLPLWRFSPEFAGGFRRFAGSFPCWSPWWKLSGGGGSGRISPNKLVFGPLRVRILLFLASSSCCHGGRGREVEVRWFWGLFVVDLQLLPALKRELLRVTALALAVGTGLTVGVNRGVAPVDAPSTSPRSRRPRRVADAATSTRFFPLTFCSGDSAVACGCFFSHSGEAEALMQAAADLVLRRRSHMLGCIFLFLRVLSVKGGQLSQIWMFLVISSCFLT